MKKYNIFILIFAFPLFSHSFPDMVRHGYTTCVTCHFSPSGGGLLNSYGKFIAGELFGSLNTSENALPWLVEPIDSPKYSIGLLARGAQTYFDTSTETRAQFRRMQFDLEGGFIKDNWYGFATAGFKGSAIKPGQNETDLKMRSAYIAHGDINHAIRIGRFFPEYGLKHPNHNIPTRKGLYWNEGDEPYLAQASYFTELMDYSLAYVQGADAGTSLVDKFGYTGSVVIKSAHTRSGFSFLDMSNGAGRTYSRSLFSQIGYEENGYTLIEAALKFDSRSTDGPDLQKNVLFIESGWEVKHGIIPYIGYQKTNVLATQQVATAYPIGVRFYPITHFELVAEYAPNLIETPSKNTNGSSAFLMANMYF